MSVVIAEGPMQLGGHEATSNVPDRYQGACKLIDNSEDKVMTVLPNKDEAFSAASYAITPDGGYCSVVVEAARESEITHPGWQE